LLDQRKTRKETLTLSAGFIQEREPVEGSPAREPESTAERRLGVDIGGAGGKVAAVFFFLEGHWLGKCCCESLRDAVVGQPRKISCG
jgi:hypothetical protein